MKRESYSEEEIKNLLKRMPSVQDKKSKEEWYQQISSRLELDDKKQRRKNIFKQPWVLPSFAAVAVVLILSIMSPNLFFQNGMNDSAQLMDNSPNDAGSNNMAALPKNDGNNESLPSDHMGIMELQNLQSHISPLDSENTRSIQYVFPSENFLYNVPVTVISNKEQTKEEMYQQLQEDQSEWLGQWGLQNTFFQDVTFEFDDDAATIHVQIPQSFFTSNGSGIEYLFYKALYQMFGNTEYKKMVFIDENGEVGVDFPHIGDSMEEVTIHQPMNELYYLYKENEDAMGMLVPVESETKDVESAVQSLKNTNDDPLLLSVIPENLEIDRAETLNDEIVTVEFSEGTTLLAVQEHLTMIEAILLTAKSFGYNEVQFANTGIESLANYDLTKPISVPTNPINPIYFPN